MEFKKIREEKAVDSLVALMKEGNYRKASVKLGEIRGDPSEFMNLFSYLIHNTTLHGAKVKISPVKAKISCGNCSWKGDGHVLFDHVRCPRCRHEEVEVLQGNEFSVEV